MEERVYLETDPGVSRRVVPDLHVAQLRRTPESATALREEGIALAEPEIFEISEEPITTLNGRPNCSRAQARPDRLSWVTL